MSSKLSTCLAVAGVVMMLAGLCFLPAGLRDDSEATTLAAGMCVFSAGALIAALGVYLKARALKGAGIVPAETASDTSAKRKGRGGCDLCGVEAPVVLCTVHQINVCGACLVQHYDQRSCAYVPTKRTAGAAKTAKPLAKAKGA